MADNYLAHHGIKGQKWYERRFQNPDGSLTALGRMRYGVGESIKKTVPRVRIVVQSRKQKSKTIKEELKALSEQEKEAAKQKAIRSGDARQILKYQDQMTLQELNDATNRMRTVKQINDQADADAKKIQELNDYNKKSHKLARGVMKLADVSMKTVETGQKFVDAYKKAKKWLNDDEEDMSKILDQPLDKVLSKLDKIPTKNLQVVNNALNAYKTILGGGNNDGNNQNGDDQNDQGNGNGGSNLGGGKKKNKNKQNQGNNQQNVNTNDSSDDNSQATQQSSSEPKQKQRTYEEIHANDYDPNTSAESFRERVISNSKSQLISPDRDKELSWERIQNYWDKRNGSNSTGKAENKGEQIVSNLKDQDVWYMGF